MSYAKSMSPKELREAYEEVPHMRLREMLKYKAEEKGIAGFSFDLS